jgi:hypothetical protein
LESSQQYQKFTFTDCQERLCFVIVPRSMALSRGRVRVESQMVTHRKRESQDHVRRRSARNVLIAIEAVAVLEEDVE